jgi:serine/threonine protein kinase
MSTSVESKQIINGRYEVQSLISQSNSEYLWQAVDTLQAGDNIILQELVVGENANLASVFANFQNEINTLTSFSHQQVEQIRDFFHTDDRIFVVKSYISGETYKDLQRSTPAFSEPEIIELLKQLLPILSKLHQQPASHRNISPESIMRRASDRLPVMTDFAVVRDIASQLFTEDREPRLLDRIRQLPIGFISPGVGEDLYSLAVTAIVLLTGKSVDVLFDRQTRAWEWENWKVVSDKLASVLNKMLSMQPMERFSSADATLSALNDTRSTIIQQPVYQQPIYQDRQEFYDPQEDSPRQPQAPTPEQIIATAASAATAATIVAKAATSAAVTATSAAATATSAAAQKASASVSTNLKKVQLQDWHKAALAGGGAGLLLLIGGIWFLSTRSEPPATIITSVAATSDAPKTSSSPSPSSDATPSDAPKASSSPSSSPDATPGNPMGMPSSSSPSTSSSSTSQITKESASSTVQQWLAAKRTMFAPPYDRAIGTKLLAEKAYQDNVDKSGSPTCNRSDPDSCLSSMEWLRTNNAQYTYGVQKLDAVTDFQVNGDRATIFVNTTEYRTLYKGSKSTPSGGSDRVRYDLKYENGDVKITDYKVLK